MFSIVMIFSALMVISSRNPVHSVLFLILSFINSSALFILIGAEFIAMILAVVYVGAVAVLFLFVVMMLDINFVKLREGFLQYLPIGFLLGLVLFIELCLFILTLIVSCVSVKCFLAKSKSSSSQNESLVLKLFCFIIKGKH